MKNLALLQAHPKKIGNDQVTTDLCTVFNRLLAVASRLDSVESAFSYELTAEPLSLFKDGRMRKADKAALRNYVMPSHLSVSPNTIEHIGASFIDGGALLHRVRWEKGHTFEEVAKVYVTYVKRHHSHPTVIIDGYEGIGIKTQEHLRRNSVPLSSYVEVRSESTCVFNQDRYFSLTENKAAFIAFLSLCLDAASVPVIQCSDEADRSWQSILPKEKPKRVCLWRTTRTWP